MKRNFPRHRTVERTLDRSEWDFSDCPASEVVQCYFYEYARSSAAFCFKYQQIRKSTPPDALNSTFLALENGYRFTLDCPEFPSTPWLKIPSDVRTRRFYQRFVFIQNSCDPTDPIRPLGFSPNTGEEVLKFEVCWMATKEQLLQDFEKWVDNWLDRRKGEIRIARKRDSSENQKNPESISERHQPIKHAKSLLKALSAYRLLRKMSSADAHALTSELGDKEVPALYQSASAWSRAKARAEEVIANFDASLHLPTQFSAER